MLLSPSVRTPLDPNRIPNILQPLRILNKHLCSVKLGWSTLCSCYWVHYLPPLSKLPSSSLNEWDTHTSPFKEMFLLARWNTRSLMVTTTSWTVGRPSTSLF